MQGLIAHTSAKALPAYAIVWLDEFSSMVSPEYLFLQMASELSLPSLIMLGHELCGNFALPPRDDGSPSANQVLPVTSVSRILDFLNAMHMSWGAKRARNALWYVSNYAASKPEAVLAAVYSLPRIEHGYGLAPLTLNKRIDVTGSTDARNKSRYPDLLFSFAPVGINYDGEGHLDLRGIVRDAQAVALAQGEDRAMRKVELANQLLLVRSKVVDDITRNRQLATRGYLVLPMTKENLYDEGSLDLFTTQMLECAHSVFDADVEDDIRAIEDKSEANKRQELVRELLAWR